MTKKKSKKRKQDARGAAAAAPTGGTRRAVAHLGAASAVFVVLATATYLVPQGTVFAVPGGEIDFDRLRPWQEGDAVPIVSRFESSEDGEDAEVGGVTGSYRAPVYMRREIERRLGKAVAANLGEEAGLAAEPPRPHRQSRGSSGPAVFIDPSEYEGIEVEIERPEALAPFFRTLERTAREEPHALTRIAHFGDSSIATDLMTYTLRRRFQTRFGDGGHGFVLVARGTMPYSHRDVVHRASSSWELRQIVSEQDRSGLYGYGGVQYRGGRGAYAVFGTDAEAPVGQRVSRFEVFYRKEPRAGRMRYRVDRGEWTTLDAAGGPEDAFASIDVEDGAHRLELQPAGGGAVQLYGVVLERDGPGVVYDSLGMVGARARRMLGFDAAHLRAQLEHRGVSLLVLGFGGNEADDPVAVTRRHYEEEFVRVIRHMRAGRSDMACLVFAPLDQGHRDERGRVATMPAIPIIVEAQRSAARREGCAFYDTFRAMGGEGSMGAWSRSRPRLALSDYRHATPAGYEVIGNMFYKALLRAFAEQLDGQSARGR